VSAAWALATVKKEKENNQLAARKKKLQQWQYFLSAMIWQ